MKVSQLLSRKAKHRPQTTSTDVFRILYGREPKPQEATAVAHVPVSNTEYAKAFRTIIGRFDPQFFNTPFAVRMSRSDVSFVQVEDVALAVDAADVAVSSSLISNGSFEPHLIQFLKNRIKPGMTVIDVG